MPLTNASLTANFTWTLYRTNTGFRNTKQGPESSPFSLQSLDTDTWNQVATQTYTIASSAVQTIDLQSLTNLVYETFSATKVKSVKIQPSGDQVTFGPAAASGLVWPFADASDAAVIEANGIFLASGPASGTGHTVDGTHRYWKLTGSGAGTTTVDVEILLSTL